MDNYPISNYNNCYKYSLLYILTFNIIPVPIYISILYFFFDYNIESFLTIILLVFYKFNNIILVYNSIKLYTREELHNNIRLNYVITEKLQLIMTSLLIIFLLIDIDYKNQNPFYYYMIIFVLVESNIKYILKVILELINNFITKSNIKETGSHLDDIEIINPKEIRETHDLSNSDMLDVSCICSICLSPLISNNQFLLGKLPCNHIYHKSCILTWLAEKKSCPQCRKPIECIPDSGNNFDYASI